MAISSFIQRSFQNSSNLTTATSTVTDTGLIAIQETVAPTVTSTINLSYDDATAVAVYVQVTTDGTTVNPGSGTSATLTFTDSTIPYVWQTDCNYVNVWDDVFTTVDVHNVSTTDDCLVTIWVAYTV